MPRRDLVGWAVFALAIGILAMVLAVYFQRGFVPGDATVYLAAGQRLNAGHHLYSLSPGDTPVGLKPPYWTVPLLSPPPIAVIFRPLAMLPGDSGAYIWWVGTMTAIAASILLLARRALLATGLTVLALCVPIAYEFGVGNVNAFLLLGTLATWWLIRDGRERPAGAIVAVMTAVKVSPAVLALWLVGQRRWRAVQGGVVGAVAIALVSLAGAGLTAHLDYLGIMGQTTSGGPSDLSLAGMARFLGMPSGTARFLPEVGLVIGLTAMVAARRRVGLSYAIAVATMTLASPVVNINTFAMLLGCLAPLAWPARAAEFDAIDRPNAERRPLERPVSATGN